LSIFTGLIAEQEEFDTLRQIFYELDEDKDGDIEGKELKDRRCSTIKAKEEIDKRGGKNREKWNEVLDKLDLDGNGMVDYHEFLTAAIDH